MPYPPAGTALRLGLGALLLACLTLAACALHPGGDEIAFLRAGQLWTVNPDGTDARAIAGGNTVGFAWSPDHHQIVFRYASAAQPAQGVLSAPDAPGDLGVIGVDGGAVVTITPQVAGLARSDAWWTAQGNRLLYREGFPLAPGQQPSSPTYVLSQSDQPAGIARKLLPSGASIPAAAPDGSLVALVDQVGNVRVGVPATTGRILASEALLQLPAGNRTARVLWQPYHDALLFARSSASGDGDVTLLLTDLQGRARPIGTSNALLDYAFAPDGNALLVRTATAFEIWGMHGTAEHPAIFSWPETDALAPAWWSPDGRYVLVRDGAGLWLVNARARAIRQLLAAPPEAPSTPSFATGAASWRPLVASPWSQDSQRIVFADPGTGVWRGRALPAPRDSSGGLYVAGVGNGASPPTLVDTGTATWPSWSTLDPSASFLAAS